MRVFVTVVCILGCIVFTLMSACFGWVGLFVMQEGGRGSNLVGALVFLGIGAVLLLVAFLLGREAKRRLSSGS
jgi:apolipoprotein N-acyltransferase